MEFENYEEFLNAASLDGKVHPFLCMRVMLIPPSVVSSRYSILLRFTGCYIPDVGELCCINKLSLPPMLVSSPWFFIYGSVVSSGIACVLFLIFISFNRSFAKLRPPFKIRRLHICS